MNQVIRDILAERDSQDKKWGTQSHPYPLWKVILGEELGEADKEYLDLNMQGLSTDPNFRMVVGPDFRKELVQAAAVAVSMIECGDREGWFE